MTGDELEAFLGDQGYAVERIAGADGVAYTLVRTVRITSGGLAGTVCDVALAYVTSVPYVTPAAIHTRPALLPMQGGEPYGTQASGIGPDWQYWSRRYERPPTPDGIWLHILTVLNDDRWPAR